MSSSENTKCAGVKVTLLSETCMQSNRLDCHASNSAELFQCSGNDFWGVDASREEMLRMYRG